MSDLGRVLRLDARRTALLVAVPVLTAVGTAAAVASLRSPVAYWDNSVVALVNAVRLLGPVAAGLAAWTAVRERPLDYLRDLTARSPATGVLFDLLLLSAAGLLSYTAITFVVAAVTVLEQGAGRPPALGAAAGAGSLVLHIVAGYLAGRVLPHRATAAAVLAAASLWAALRVPGMSWWSLLPPAAFRRVHLFTALRPEVLLDQVLWAAGATAALILGYVMWATRRALIAGPLVVALTTVAAATAGLHASGGGTAMPAAPVPACRQWPLTICVHPALRAALPGLTTAVLPLAARLDGTPGAFTRVEQRPAWAPTTVSGGVAEIHLDENLTPGYGARAVRQIRDGLLSGRPCTTSYEALVDAWLTGTEPPPVPDAPTARRFATWDESHRRDWLRLHYTRYSTCALGPQDFLGRRGAPYTPGAAGAAGLAQKRSTRNGATGRTAAPRARTVRLRSHPSWSRTRNTSPT